MISLVFIHSSIALFALFLCSLQAFVIFEFEEQQIKGSLRLEGEKESGKDTNTNTFKECRQPSSPCKKGPR